MQVFRDGNQFEIILFPAEAGIFQRALRDIASSYRKPPRSHPGDIGRLWEEPALSMDKEDEKIWQEDMQGFRGENARLADDLLVQLANVREIPCVLQVPLEQIDSVVTILNDQRLYLAARHGIGEEEMGGEMDAVSDEILKNALLQIHLLAWLIELVLMRMDEG